MLAFGGDAWDEAMRDGVEIPARNAMSGLSADPHDRSRAWRLPCTSGEAMRRVRARGPKTVWAGSSGSGRGSGAKGPVLWVDYYDDPTETAVRVILGGEPYAKGSCVVVVWERMDARGIWGRLLAHGRGAAGP